MHGVPPASGRPPAAAASIPPRVGRRPLLPLFLVAVLLGAATASPGPPAIAAEGFGRPVRLGAIAAGGDAQVAMAGGAAGPIAVWEDGEGVRLQALDSGEARREVASRGVRGVWAGRAGGTPVVAWLERDLADGRMHLRWRWRGETRSAVRSGQLPRVRVVRGGARPELLVATPRADGWRLALHAWDGTRRAFGPRPRTVAGLDAVRDGAAVRISWLEGTNEVALGRLEASWTAYLARWPDGAERPEAPRALGPARWRGAGDVTRQATTPPLEVGWPGPDGVLRVTAPEGPVRSLEPGRLVGRLGGAWTWLRGAELRQLLGDDVRTVLRLPAAPEHAAGAHVAGVTGVVWSSGRYLGGLEVWAASDRSAYRASWIERLALAMGWDPWRPWSAAGGHTLLSGLAALLLSTAFAPLWWLGAALLSRRRGAARSTVLEGALLGVGSVAAVAAVVGARAAATGTVSAAALTGGPLGVAAAGAAGLAVATSALARRDLEATSGRLLAAWLAGLAMLLVLSFLTLTAWQRLAGATP
jgi:hypothetical protein